MRVIYTDINELVMEIALDTWVANEVQYDALAASSA